MASGRFTLTKDDGPSGSKNAIFSNSMQMWLTTAHVYSNSAAEMCVETSDNVRQIQNKKIIFSQNSIDPGKSQKAKLVIHLELNYHLEGPGELDLCSLILNSCFTLKFQRLALHKHGADVKATAAALCVP